MAKARHSSDQEATNNANNVRIKITSMTESELKRQLSQDLANNPVLATVFNPPQVFSDEHLVMWNNSSDEVRRAEMPKIAIFSNTIFIQ